MRALITGAGGLLGHALARHLAGRGDRVWGAFRHPPDHWPFGQVVPLELGAVPGAPGSADQACAIAEPEVVFHLAAWTNVDECEAQPLAAWTVNVTGTVHVARAAYAAGARLVFMSTDYVFDGGAGPYGEDRPPSPVNWYGRTKARGEEVAQAAHPGVLILRSTFYGFHPDGHGALARLLAALRAGRRQALRPDAYFSPLPAPLLAQRMAELAEGGLSGLRHLPGPRCSRWEFGRAVAQRFGLEPSLVEPGPGEAVTGRAPRPVDTSLTTRFPSPWPDGHLHEHLAALYEEEPA